MHLWGFPERILQVMLRGWWIHVFGFSGDQMPPRFKAACKSKPTAAGNPLNLSALGLEMIRVSSRVQHPKSHSKAP